MVGKIPPKLMEKIVYMRLGALDPNVLVGPAIGEDAAIIDLNDGRVLIVHNDAITGASEILGWLAVNIVANDIAVRGAKPRWFLISLFLPEGSSENLLEEVMTQIDRAAKDLGIMVIGGHTETTSGLDRPIAGTTALGIAEKNRIVTTSGARVGDYLIMTKTAAIEGTAILCTDFADTLMDRGVAENVLKRGSRFIANVSVMKEALALAEEGLATAMHDPTEGGLLGGVAELAYASHKTIELWANKVPIAEETRIVTDVLGVDALRLISSGSLIASIPPSKVDKAISTLHEIGVESTVIGRVKDYRGHLVESIGDQSITFLDEVYVADELFNLWKRLKS
ncbi:MAG: AIR synthase family protein [Candidatus Bathyarchaeota archaeon]|nr:AIR synthase family protein [Candidatus Bathyarchaeota archaeon]